MRSESRVPRHRTAPRAGALCAMLLAIAGMGCSDTSGTAWSGYAEGEYVFVAAPLPGRLDAVAVVTGQQVQVGSALFQLESHNEDAAQKEATHRETGAVAEAVDLTKGKRAAELAVIRAQLAQAQANAELAGNNLARQQQLVTQGFVAKASVEDATSGLHLAQARVAELQASLQVAQLPGRDDVRAASGANVRAAHAAVLQSAWRLAQKQQVATVAGEVADVFFQPGEFIAAGQPVLSILPPGNRKARFFVPESDLARVQLGQTVQIHCDACGATPMLARISRISTQPEFTPPVIYSNSQRAKLVYLIEARPDPAQAVLLKPGQPLDVALAQPAAKP